MLEVLFSDPKAIERLRRTPLGSHLDSFTTATLALGYKRFTVRQQVWLLRDLGHWLRRRGISVSELDEAVLEKFLGLCRRRGRLTRGDATTVRRLLAHLRERHIVPPGEVLRDDSAIARLLSRYEPHLRQERGLASVTVANYLPIVRRFLAERFGDGPVHLDTLNPSDLEGFVVRHARSMSAKRAQLMVSALRSFLRFLLQQGEITTDLASGVPTVAGGGRTSVPKYLSPQEVERLLKGCDRCTTVGRRDYDLPPWNRSG
jgi:site-specific recombinase XerD